MLKNTLVLVSIVFGSIGVITACKALAEVRHYKRINTVYSARVESYRRNLYGVVNPMYVCKQKSGTQDK